MSIETIQQVYQFLDRIPAFKAEGKTAANFSLERFRKFCVAIDNPHHQFPSIHVGGSNGKGSTCQITASIYRQAGYDVGLYSSPHIIDYRERFTINGEQIKEAELVEFFKLYQPLIKSFRLTYFEISTAIAFWWFAQRQVDVALIEVGLGGRLDATNVITPLASVITTITLDHTDLLGNTIEAITAEKAGIIKREVPVVLGNIPVEAQRVIQTTAKMHGAPVFNSTDYKPDCKNGTYHLRVEGKQLRLQSTLQLPVQAYNIAVAWQVSRVLNDALPVTEQNRRAGVENIGNLFTNIARFKKLDPTFDWYFDGAHNIQAVREMKKMVQTIRPISESILVLSLMHDKISKKMILEFSEFKKIIYHALPLGRAATFDDVQTWLPRVQPFPVKKTSRKSLLKEFESELVIFAGSFYFYATVRDWLSS